MDTLSAVTSWPLLPWIVGASMDHMKRLLAAPLWFIDGWFVGAAAALALGVSPVLAPILALATAGIVVADPRRVIWSRSTGSSLQQPGQASN